MKYVKLGHSDLNVSVCCMGTMTFGERNTEAEGFAIMDKALELGVNFFDCAEMYPVPAKEETQGASEVILGKWMKTKKREDLIIATKIAGYNDSSYIPSNRTDPRSGDNPTESRLDSVNISAAVEGSLRRLQTDYIDLYQTHWPDRYVPGFGSESYKYSSARDNTVPLEETVQAIGDLIKSGKIRHWGVSNETAYGIGEIMHACRRLSVPAPISIQNSYSLIHRHFENALAESCAPWHYNVSLLAWSPLAGGALTGSYTPSGRLHTSSNTQQITRTHSVHSSTRPLVLTTHTAVAFRRNRHSTLTPTLITRTSAQAST
eukprot:GFYU01010376.1.p1 GENE.GFYU01010376.1~~GFYU01010376.1.p1  ORF type:complete len:335 (-),score=70.01 GFYU01010376.1:432-1385(-)